MLFFFMIFSGLTSVFFFSAAPQVLVAVLLSLVLSISLFSAGISSNPWFSYLFLLVFLGGLMVILSYVVSFAGSSSTLFSFPWKKIFLFFFSTTVLLMLGYFHNFSFSTGELVFSLTSWEEVSSMIFLGTSSGVYIYLFVYLLVTLVFLSFILKIYAGPLRNLSDE